jgi:hypothetical protein
MRHALAACVLVALGACVPPLPDAVLEGAAGGAGSQGAGTGGLAGGSAGMAAGGRGGAPRGGFGGRPPLAGRGGVPFNTGMAASPASDASVPPTCAPASCAEQPACVPPSWNGSPVSSFETACGTIDAVDGRDGGWFIYTTASSTASPGPTEPFRVSCESADNSCYSACVSGTLNGNGVDWPTVGIGFTPRANAAAYDASRYSAIAFWIRAFVGPNSTLRLLVPLKADTIVGTGDGACTTNCFDAYSVVLSPTPWTHTFVPFAALTQQGFGPPEAWDPTTVISFQWTVTATMSRDLVGEPFTICVDQVELIP